MPEQRDALEVELKFTASGPEPLRTLETAERLGPAELGPPRRFGEVDRYLDTADRAIAAAGWACRLRSRDGRWIVSLKGPPAGLPGDGAALHRRRELEAVAADATDPHRWPSSEARRRVLAWSRGAPLVEQVRLAQERIERSVIAEARPIGLLSLDRVGVLRNGQRLGMLMIVELELAAAAAGREPALAASLAGVGGLQPDPCTKLERALAMVKAAGPPARSG